MTKREARERGLDCFTLPTMERALRFACERLDVAVAVFREEVAHFDTFVVAVAPRPGVCKFTRAN